MKKVTPHWSRVGRRRRGLVAHEFLDVSEDTTGIGLSQVPGFPPFPGATLQTDIIRLRCLSSGRPACDLDADPECPGGPCGLCAAGGLACDPSLFIPPTNEITQNSEEKWASRNVDCYGRFDWRNFEKGTAEQKLVWNRRRRANRFWWRAHLGAAIAIALNERSTGERLCRLRWHSQGFSTSLHESSELPGLMNEFDQWLRRHCGGDYEFIRVEQRHSQKLRSDGCEGHHFHTISRGTEKIPVVEANAWLEKQVGVDPVKGKSRSHISGLEVVKDVSKSVVYLSGYLQGLGKFVQYRESQRWGGPRGNMGYCKAVRRVTGELLPVEDLVSLAMLPESEGRALVKSYGAAHPRPVAPDYVSVDGYGSYESINCAPLYDHSCRRAEQAALDGEWRRLGAERDAAEVLRCIKSQFESVRCVERLAPFTLGLPL